jgi:membrane protein implicated in regulation of membrane protease activity
VWFVVGVLLNIASFALCVLGQTLAAASVYLVSLALIFIGRRGRKEKREEKRQVETRQEPTPDEIKRRPVSAPEI